jgi:hypothetical protein
MLKVREKYKLGILEKGKQREREDLEKKRKAFFELSCM